MKIFAVIFRNQLFFFNNDTNAWTERTSSDLYFENPTSEVSYEITVNENKNLPYLEFEVNVESEIIPYIKSQWTELWL